MPNGALEPAAVNHVSETVTGVIVGGLAAGAAVALTPIILPTLGLATLGATAVAAINAVPWIGAAAGGWIGYNRAETKAQRYGIRKS